MGAEVHEDAQRAEDGAPSGSRGEEAAAPAGGTPGAAAGPGARAAVPLGLICAIFFCSGMPALIYQLMWQRSLFAIFGINVESVTVIVAAFMLGLGLGSLAGGVVSKRPRLPLLLIFGLIELGIATFGLLSLHLFEWVGSITLALPALLTGLVTFGLVLVPTLLMGATLPILVAYLVERSGNVGRSVGLLYFVNTLGSAMACFLGAFLLFGALGMSGSVYFAVAANILVGGGAVALHLSGRGRAPADDGEAGFEPVRLSLFVAIASATFAAGYEIVWQGLLRRGPRPLADRAEAEEGAPPFGLALLLVFLCGYISLSYEILWFRVVSFATGGRAAAFSILLGLFLLGIALGSLVSRRFCPDERGRPTHWRALAAFVLLANLLGFFVVPAAGYGATALHYGAFVAVSTTLVVLAAGALGATFPLIAHLGVRPGPDAGARVSYLYLANILGSSAGSLLTGFVLLDRFSLGTIGVFLALLGLLMGAALLVPARLSPAQRGLAAGAALAVAVVVFAGRERFFDDLYPRLQFFSRYGLDQVEFGDNRVALGTIVKDDAQGVLLDQEGTLALIPRAEVEGVSRWEKERRVVEVIENKSGVITVTADKHVYGGGIYDGVFSTDIVNDQNIIVRAYALSLWHPSPKRVLMIGLATGSWAQVIVHNPHVEKLVAVEINPGYVELIKRHDEIKRVLEHPKLEVVIDDGRRYLKRGTDRFDMVVMNTTYHWRGHATNILSQEFLELVRTRLAPGGVVQYNTTSSDRAQKTGCTVFPYALRFVNNMVCSDSPIQVDGERWRRVLLDYRIEGRPVLDLRVERDRRKLESLLGKLAGLSVKEQGPKAERQYWMEPRESILARTADRPLITDDNMGTEWEEFDRLIWD